MPEPEVANALGGLKLSLGDGNKVLGGNGKKLDIVAAVICLFAQVHFSQVCLSNNPFGRAALSCGGALPHFEHLDGCYRPS